MESEEGGSDENDSSEGPSYRILTDFADERYFFPGYTPRSMALKSVEDSFFGNIIRLIIFAMLPSDVAYYSRILALAAPAPTSETIAKCGSWTRI